MGPGRAFPLAGPRPAAQIHGMTEDLSAGRGSTDLKFRDTGDHSGAQPRSPLLQTLLSYWQSKCGPDGILPGRQDLDPLELRSLLPSIYLVDVLDGNSFRIRLLGEEHVQIYGNGVVGRVIDDIFPPPAAAEFNRLYAAVVRRRTPVINRGQITWLQSHTWMHFEGLHAPLAGDGSNIDTIFGAGVFSDPDAG